MGYPLAAANQELRKCLVIVGINNVANNVSISIID